MEYLTWMRARSDDSDRHDRCSPTRSDGLDETLAIPLVLPQLLAEVADSTVHDQVRG
jgi:hypothetical protein